MSKGFDYSIKFCERMPSETWNDNKYKIAEFVANCWISRDPDKAWAKFTEEYDDRLQAVVDDNRCKHDGMMPIVWNRSTESLRKATRDALARIPNHGNSSYWMGTYADLRIYDVKSEKETSREVFYVGEWL